MAKPKYKKVTTEAEREKNTAPLRVVINSDGNIIEFVSFSSGIYTYRYTLSNTKMNQLVTFTQEHFTKFLQRNEQISPQAFLPYKPPPARVILKMQPGCKKSSSRKLGR